MIIKVIGEGCKDCDKLYENVTEAVNELNLDAKVEKVEDLIEIVKLGVMTSPSVMVDGKLVVSGNVASVKNLVKILKKEMWQNISHYQLNKWYINITISIYLPLSAKIFKSYMIFLKLIKVEIHLTQLFNKKSELIII